MTEERTHSGRKEHSQQQASNEDSDKEEDELNFKMSVGIEVMGVMNRADNTGAKNLVIMIVKSISIYFEDNAGGVVYVQGDEGSAITRPVSQEHLGCDRQRCCVHSRTAPGNVRVRSASGWICRAPGNP